MENRNINYEQEADSTEHDIDECEKDDSEHVVSTDSASVDCQDLNLEVNPSLSSILQHSCRPETEDVSMGENVSGVSNNVTIADKDHQFDIRIGTSGAEEIRLSGIGDSTSVELGLMDRIIADMKPSLTDLGEIALPHSVREGGSGKEVEKREIIETADRDKNGIENTVAWKQRYFEEDDIQHCLSSPRPGQPPSGPFVVGSQSDMTERYSGELADSCSTSVGSHRMENSSSSPSGLETNPFFGHSVLEAFKWHSAAIPGYPDRSTLKRLPECPPARQQKVRTDLTLADKVRLINVSETTGRSQRSLAAEFHISVGSVNNILRRKREYKEAFENKDSTITSSNSSSSSNKAPRCFRSEKIAPVSDLQRLMVRWVDMARTKVKPLTWPMVLDKAREFAARLKVTSPNPSVAWLQTLHQSLNIPLHAAGVAVRSENDATLMNMWHKMMPFLVQGYQPENIFSITETTLYYKCLPDCCYVGGPTCQNCSEHLDLLEHRLTVLLCCNMLGERLKPLVISRHACPPSMRSVAMGDLPVVWCHHSSAAITADIFTGWLRDLETSMAQQRRHIALFMEMTPSHLSAMLLKHVGLKFYLDDSAHLLQPFNHGIVRHFKAYFRRRLLQTALAHRSAVGESAVSDGGLQAVRAVTELDVIFWIQDAWRTVSLDTIRTSFHKAAFPHSSHPIPAYLPEARSEPLPGDFLHLVQEAGRVFHFTPMEATLYAEFDSQLPCHSSDMEDWERTLLADATAGPRTLIKKEPGMFDDESGHGCLVQSSQMGEVQDSREKGVEPSEALDSLCTLKRFSANNIGLLTTVFELESMLLDSIGFSGHA